MSINKVCVTLTSSLGISEEYLSLASSVGKSLAVSGYELIYGGTAYGMMFNLAQSYKDNGGKKITGVFAESLMKITKNYKKQFLN